MRFSRWSLVVVLAAGLAATPTSRAGDADTEALLALLPSSRRTLADGVRQIERDFGAAISAKFELDHDGRLSLSVYAAQRGLDHDAEHNVLAEFAGSPTSQTWAPSKEVFEDVPHVARSAQQQTLMALTRLTLAEVIAKAEAAQPGTVFSVTPALRARRPVFVVLSAADGKATELVFDLSTAERVAAAAPSGTIWKFDGDPAGKPPAGFSFARTGDGRIGRWEVIADPSAPSGPNVLAQLDADRTDERYPVAVADAPALRDVRLSVRCKAVSGEIDQAVGLVLRYRGEGDYYLTRANALEGNIRLYFVKGGRRQQIATWSGAVTAGEWHDYRIEARGDHFQVWWDGAKVLDHRDATFPGAGRVGLWTKADSVSWFDDLAVEPL